MHARPTFVRLLGLVVGLLFSFGCAGAPWIDDGSVSLGHSSAGALLGSVAIPAEGTGFAMTPAWRARGHFFTTDRVARWLMGALSAAADPSGDHPVFVGDLSTRTGGDIQGHRSHESGRDIDILLPALLYGESYQHKDALLRFGPEGHAFAWSPARPGVFMRGPVPPVTFDARRTWAVVRALLREPGVEIQWIFLHESLAALVLAHGRAAGDPDEVVERAAWVFRRPSDAPPHDDHMHIRVFCDSADRRPGCLDRGPVHWWKKRWKYLGAPPDVAL